MENTVRVVLESLIDEVENVGSPKKMVVFTQGGNGGKFHLSASVGLNEVELSFFREMGELFDLESDRPTTEASLRSIVRVLQATKIPKDALKRFFTAMFLAEVERELICQRAILEAKQRLGMLRSSKVEDFESTKESIRDIHAKLSAAIAETSKVEKESLLSWAADGILKHLADKT